MALKRRSFALDLCWSWIYGHQPWPWPGQVHQRPRTWSNCFHLSAAVSFTKSFFSLLVLLGENFPFRPAASRVPLVIYDRRRLAASGHQLPLVPTGILPNQPELNGMRENRLLFGDYQQIWRSSNGFSDFSSIFSRKKNLKDVTLTEGSSSICLTKCGRK